MTQAPFQAHSLTTLGSKKPGQVNAAPRQQGVDGKIKPDEIVGVVNDPGRIALAKFYKKTVRSFMSMIHRGLY